jgi:two-component system OmpR family response regulator
LSRRNKRCLAVGELQRDVASLLARTDMRLLLVEDSERLLGLLAESLRGAGFRLDLASSVADLMSTAATVDYDLILLDLGLPDGDGLEAIRSLRAKGSKAPILILTARGDVSDRVVGLDAGADDYLIKPFNHAELLARVRALLRRPLDLKGPILRKGGIELDEASGEVRCRGVRLDLRPSERRLLAVLLRSAATVVPKSTIEEALSEFGREVSSNAVEALISRLRRALGAAHSGLSVETVRGVGYELREELP